MGERELNEYILSYRSTVYRLAYSYLKNREDAEDISQEAFLRLYRTEQSFGSGENVKAWLIRVTVNLCKNLLKSSWHKNRFGLASEELPQSGRSAEQLQAPPEVNEVGECIRRLKPEYSGVLYLYYYEGYSVKEIAGICGISSVAVRTRLSRGRNQLREMLLKEDAL